MTREIKFRAWNENDKKMVDLYKITSFALDKELDIDGLFIPFDDNFILMQYTERNDMNGFNIYEGDILKNHIDNSTGYISYLDERTEYIYDEYKTGDRTSKGCSLSELKNIEVIGNIYENKELIK